jgi:formate-dependent nitrite reductase membrane component NrfD
MMVNAYVILYLLLGGAGAGCLFVAAAVELRTFAGRAERPTEASRPFFAPVYTIALIALAAAALALVGDLGRPDRLIELLTHPGASYLGVGTYLLAASILLAVLLATVWTFRLRRPPRAWTLITLILALLAAFGTMFYTGLMFWDIGYGTLLHVFLLPVLFLLSALSTGIALIFLALNLADAVSAFAGLTRQLARVDMLLIALEVIAMAALLGCAWLSPGTAGEVAGLLWGPHALLFWAVFVVLGLLLPLVLEATGGRLATLAASGAVLVGGYAMRFLVLVAALAPLVMVTLEP